MAANPKLIRKSNGAIAPPEWSGREYTHVEPGEYLVRVTDFQGPLWVRRYHRWSLRVECSFVYESGKVSAFFPFGNNIEKLSSPGRSSRYFKAWCMANGAPPEQGQAMDWEILRDRCFTVRVEDSVDGSYSRITEFLKLEDMDFRTG